MHKRAHQRFNRRFVDGGLGDGEFGLGIVAADVADCRSGLGDGDRILIGQKPDQCRDGRCGLTADQPDGTGRMPANPRLLIRHRLDQRFECLDPATPPGCDGIDRDHAGAAVVGGGEGLDEFGQIVSLHDGSRLGLGCRIGCRLGHRDGRLRAGLRAGLGGRRAAGG